MASRTLIIASLLGASVGVPYLASQSQHKPTTPGSTGSTSSVSSVGSSSSWSPPAVASSQPWSPSALAVRPVSSAFSAGSVPSGGIMRLPVTASGTASQSMSAVDGAQFTSAAQVLRFDVTKEWVCQNWSRKSTGPTDVGLMAIRVPLVMGTQMSSLAGALTYYFNAQDQVEHISFHGKTGDATPLVQLLTQTYRFQQVPPPAGERVFEV